MSNKSIERGIMNNKFNKPIVQYNKQDQGPNTTDNDNLLQLGAHANFDLKVRPDTTVVGETTASAKVVLPFALFIQLLNYFIQKKNNQKSKP